MRSEKGNAAEILERLLSSYGVTTQKELSEKLGIASNSISNWLQRGSVSGNAIIDCALDTGADLSWLVFGKFTDARIGEFEPPPIRGSKLRQQLLNGSGGKALIRRIMDSYGFKTQTELGDYFELSSGTISTWIRRDFFPGEVVVTCAIDTGVPLYWLATGQQLVLNLAQTQNIANTSETPKSSQLLSVCKYQLSAGQMKESGEVLTDPKVLQPNISKPAYIYSGRFIWLADMAVKNIANGKWLIDLDDNVDVYSISRLPGNKLQVKNDTTEFQCSSDDIKAIGLIIATTEIHV